MTQSNTCKNTLTCNCSQCNTTLTIYSHVPQPRLVCVELNPGPLTGPEVKQIKDIVKSEVGSAKGLVAAAGEMLGRAAAKGRAKKPASKARKGNPFPGIKNSPPVGRATPLNIQRNMPIAFGQIMQSSIPNANVKIPFSTSAISLYGEVAPGPVGVIRFGTIGGGAIYRHLICPTIQPFMEDNTSTALISGRTFGGSVAQLAALYREYRITKLRCTFVPVKGTNTAGLISVGFSPDPVIETPLIVDDVCSYANNFTTSLYERVTVDLASMVGKNATQNKYYIPTDPTGTPQIVDAASNANARLTSIGAIVGVALGVTTTVTNEVLGTLRFEGEIELRDLAPRRALPTEELKEHELPPPFVRQNAQDPGSSSHSSSYSVSHLTSGYGTPNLMNQSQLGIR